MDTEVVLITKAQLDAIDRLILLSQKLGNESGRVETPSDWRFVETIYKMWKKEYPDKFLDFQKSLDYYREQEIFNRGFNKEHGAFIQHTLEMPESFYRIFKVFYPRQNLDRKFIDQLVKELPDFKLRDK